MVEARFFRNFATFLPPSHQDTSCPLHYNVMEVFCNSQRYVRSLSWFSNPLIAAIMLSAEFIGSGQFSLILYRKISLIKYLMCSCYPLPDSRLEIFRQHTKKKFENYVRLPSLMFKYGFLKHQSCQWNSTVKDGNNNQRNENDKKFL